MNPYESQSSYFFVDTALVFARIELSKSGIAIVNWIVTRTKLLNSFGLSVIIRTNIVKQTASRLLLIFNPKFALICFSLEFIFA